MLLPLQVNYWSKILNLIIQNYLIESTTICIFWNENLEFDLSTEKFEGNATEKQFVHITLNGFEKAFHDNSYDFERKRNELIRRGIPFDELVLKLTVSIEASYCEAFIAFQDDLPAVIDAFPLAHLYSDWHSVQNRLLFVYYKENENETQDYFSTRLFGVEPNILIIEAEAYNSSIFTLKTNKFVGPLSENPKQLHILNIYDAIDESFNSMPVKTLYPSKTADLQGFQVAFSSPSYPPYVFVTTDLQPQIRDRSDLNPTGSIFVDGSEVRVLMTFCELYNCTPEFDSCGDIWGAVFINASGHGCMGLLMQHRIELAYGGLFQWDYRYVDQSAYLGISSTTCIVPAPERMTSWALPLRPFQFAVWVGVIICLILEIFGLFLNRQANETLDTNAAKELTAASWRESFEFAYTTTLKLFISQSSSYIVTASSLRLLLFSCYMIDIIVTSSYGGGLASILTVPILGEAPDSLERMVKHSLRWTGQTIDWLEPISGSTDVSLWSEPSTKPTQSFCCCMQLEYILSYDTLYNFKYNTECNLSRHRFNKPIMKKVVSNFYVSSVEEMTEDAETEYRGFIVEYLTYGHFANIEHLSQNAINRFKLMIDNLYRQFTVTFFVRDWGLQQEYNQFVLWWHATGLPEHWEWLIASKHMVSYNQRRVAASKNPAIERDPVKLDIANFIGLLLIWVLGIFLSILAFGLEIFYYKRYQKRKVDNKRASFH